MTLELIRATVVGENGHILVTDGELDWTVIVSREAAEVMSRLHDVSEGDLRKHSAALLAIAEERLADGDVSGGRIWVMEKYVLGWLASRRVQKVGEMPNAFSQSNPGARAVISAPALSSAAIRSSRARACHPTHPG